MPPYREEEYIVAPIAISESTLNNDAQDFNPTPIDVFKELLADQSTQVIQSLTDHFTTQVYLLAKESNMTVNDFCKAEKVEIEAVKSLVELNNSKIEAFQNILSNCCQELTLNIVDQFKLQNSEVTISSHNQFESLTNVLSAVHQKLQRYYAQK
jgi:hypothetical protein